MFWTKEIDQLFYSKVMNNFWNYINNNGFIENVNVVGIFLIYI